jgi:transcriptional regulator with XRE-family HTH domain
LTEFNCDINQRIVEIRKALGLTQEKFANDVKISKAYQGHIEANQRRVNERIIKIISLTYGASEEWLKTGTGDMFERFDDPKIKQIVTNFKKLAPDAQDYLLKQIDLLLDYEDGKKAGGPGGPRPPGGVLGAAPLGEGVAEARRAGARGRLPPSY